MSGVHWNRRSYTREQFIEVWQSSLSIAECNRRLGLVASAGSYKSLTAAANDLGLNRDHMVGSGWNIGDKAGLCDRNKQPIETYLVEDRNVSNGFLKKRLLEEGLLESRCYAPLCPVKFKPINPFTGENAVLKLTLDHINGNNTDNRLVNLRMLCHYCHPYTETWCVGTKAQRRRKVYLCTCGKVKTKNSVKCYECHKNDLSARSGRRKSRS